MVWLRATVKRSKKPDVIIVQLDVPGAVEPPTFYMDPEMVRFPPNLAPGQAVPGEVRAVLIDQRPDGKLVVLVRGDAVSYGPRLVVPEGLAAA